MAKKINLLINGNNVYGQIRYGSFYLGKVGSPGIVAKSLADRFNTDAIDLISSLSSEKVSRKGFLILPKSELKMICSHYSRNKYKNLFG